MNYNFIFDVDGVLCDTGQKIDNTFKEWFLEWTSDKEYYLLTGGRRESTIEQVGLEIVERAAMSFHCMGNHMFIGDREFKINQFVLPDDISQWLAKRVEQSAYPVKTGDNFEQRFGSVNFSIIGRLATREQKIQYNIWDSDHQERVDLIIDFKKTFPAFDAFLGGNASIDICLKGANKAQILNFIPLDSSQIRFFGDRCMPYGIDHPLAFKCTSFQIDYGHTQTKEILLSL